jgi:enoyl-CoA hydratase
MKFLRIERQGPIAELTLARPPVNALDSALLSEIAAACAELERDDAVRGVLLRGEGKCLSAGLDLAAVAQLDAAGAAAFLGDCDAAFGALFAFSKPLAIAVDGHAIAGGTVIALCGDFIAIGRGPHKLGLTELTVGVPFPRIAFEIVRHALPPRALRVLVYGAGAMPAAEAFELGVGDVLVDDARGAARSWLEGAVNRPLDAFRFTKRLAREPGAARIAAATADERKRLIEILMTTRANIAAYLQAVKKG